MKEMKKAASLTIAWIVLICCKAFGAGPIVWVVPSSLHRVGPSDAPGGRTNVVIQAARGEFQSFQVAIQAPGGGLTNVNFSVSRLLGPRGVVLSRKNLILYREWYVTVKHHSPTYNGPPNLPIIDVDTFPDALIPFLDPATGKAPVDAHFRAAPFELVAGRNAVFWVDVFVPRGTTAGEYRGTYTVTSDQGMFKVKVCVFVWGFTLPLKPSLKSLFNGGNGSQVAGVDVELLRNRLMPDSQTLARESTDISHYGLNDYDLGYYENVSYGNCTGNYLTPAPPTLAVLQSAVNAQPPGLYLNDYTADPESSCTNTAFYDSVIAWAQVLHQAVVPDQVGVDNVVSQQPVSALFDDGLGTGRSAVDVWTMLPLNYDLAQTTTTNGIPNVTYVLQKGDKVWSYTDLVQDSYSPKWELDFLPINYRIQPGFISQSLGLTGLNYWAVTNWVSSSVAWTNPQGGNGYEAYPGEGILVYPGRPAGLKGVAPSMRLKYLRDGVEDYEYVQLLKNCGQAAFALAEAQKVGPDWTNWTRNESLLESVRERLGNRIAASNCAP